MTAPSGAQSEADRILSLTPADVLGFTLITVARLQAFAPGCDAATIAPALQSVAQAFDIDTVPRASMWLGQMFIESRGFTRLVESLTYSADRLCQVWPSRFPNLSAAAPYANNPAGLACRVYGGRLGNNATDDGWRFRGRGFIQITGRANYQHYGQALGYDLIGNPDLACQPQIAARIAGLYWSEHGLNALADAGDIRGVTLAINGGLTGLADRSMQVARAKVALTS